MATSRLNPKGFTPNLFFLCIFKGLNIRMMRNQLLFIFISLTTLSYSQMVADAGNDTIICAGESVRLGGSPTVAGGLSPYNYTWTPTTGLSNPAIANPIATPSATTEYKVTIGDANGRSIKDSLIITVLSATEVTLNDSSVCDNDGTFMLMHGFPSGGKYSGQGVSDSLNFDVTSVSYGTHQIIYHYTDTNCGAKIKDTANITLNPAPQISIHSLTDTICAGDTVTLSVNQLDTISTDYLWAPGPFEGSDTAATVQSVPDSTTNYSLIATNRFGCVEQTERSISVEICLGIYDLTTNTIQTFPNPATNLVNVLWQEPKSAMLQLINAQGKVVQTEKIVFGTNSIQTSNYPRGLYIIRITTQKDVYLGQVVLR